MPWFALWARTLKADTPQFSTTSIFVNTAKGNGRLCTWKCFGCHCGQLGTGFNWFLDRKIIWTGNKRWLGTHRRDKEGKFCRFWCWMWVWRCCTESRNYHSVQAYTFRCLKLASEKCWLHTIFQLRCFIVCALYSTPRLYAHSWALHIQKKNKL